MTNKQLRFFNVAREVSLLSDFKRARVGAVVVDGNRIISSGHNSQKTSTIQDKYNKYRHFEDLNGSLPRIHAEIAALTPLLKQGVDLTRANIYVYRELRDGTISCARPCPACKQLIHELGIKNVYYSDWDGSFVKEVEL